MYKSTFQHNQRRQLTMNPIKSTSAMTKENPIALLNQVTQQES